MMRFNKRKIFKMCMVLIWVHVALLVCDIYVRTMREERTVGYFVKILNEKTHIDDRIVFNKKFEVSTDNRNVVSGKHDVKLDNQTFNNGYMFHINNDQYQFITNGTCNNAFLPNHFSMGETWQSVDNERSMYVYSAYSVEKSIFMIGVKQKRTVKMICQLWIRIRDEQLLLLEEATCTSSLQEGSGFKYTSTLFRCPLKSSRMPTHVSLVTESCQPPLNLLLVHNASKPSNYKRQFTVCLSPLHFRYGRAYELVEWIELNKILGAKYFVVYNYSVASNVDQVLTYYSKRKDIEVVQWRLPMGVGTFPKTGQPVEIKTFGQAAALNDCLFRNKHFSEFVVNVDVDEFLIPHSRGASDWFDFFKELNANASVYIFRNAFFRKDWERKVINFTNLEVAQQLRLVTLQVFEHESTVLPAGQRSKYIARTADVNRVRIHDVPSGKSLTVPQKLGLVHHYRNWENPHDKRGKVTDTTVLQKFEHVLMQNVRTVWKDLVNVKMDIPVI